MIIRSTFAMGREEELPSSLPHGFPFFAKDTDRLFIGQGETALPKAIRSGGEAGLQELIDSINNEIDQIKDQIEINSESISQIPVDTTNIEDGYIPYYDKANHTFRFISSDRLGGGGGGGESAPQQVTLFNVEASPDDPYHLYVDIPETLSFNRRPLEILKFYSGEEGFVTVPIEFDQADQALFEPNEYITFDGTLRLKTKYERPMSKISENEDYSIWQSDPIDLNEFKTIHRLEIDAEGAKHLIKDGDYYYSFIDNEWVSLGTQVTSIDFDTSGMDKLDHLTELHDTSRITMIEEEELDDGYVYKATIDINKLKEIKKIGIVNGE